MRQSMTLVFVETLETLICPMTCVNSGTLWEERPIPVTTRFNFAFLPATLRSLEPCILLVFLCLQVRTLRIRTHIRALACMRNCSSSYPPDYRLQKLCVPPPCERQNFLASSMISVR